MCHVRKAGESVGYTRARLKPPRRNARCLRGLARPRPAGRTQRVLGACPAACPCVAVAPTSPPRPRALHAARHLCPPRGPGSSSTSGAFVRLAPGADRGAYPASIVAADRGRAAAGGSCDRVMLSTSLTVPRRGATFAPPSGRSPGSRRRSIARCSFVRARKEASPFGNRFRAGLESCRFPSAPRFSQKRMRGVRCRWSPHQ